MLLKFFRGLFALESTNKLVKMLWVS